MPYSVFAKNLMLGQLRSSIKQVSLHSGSPTKDNEVRGTRQKIAFTEPLNGEMNLPGKEMISCPEGAFVSHAAFWSGNGRLLAYGPLPVPVEFKKDGTYVLDTAVLDLNKE